MDRETQQIAQEGEKWERFVASEEWQMVKSLLLDKMIELSDLTLINESDEPSQALLTIRVNKLVVQRLHDLLKDIEGRGNQHAINKVAFEKIRKTEIIKRYEPV